MSNKHFQDFKVGDNVMISVEDGYGDFERDKIYIIASISDDLNRVKIIGCDLWWYSSRFVRVQDKFTFCIYPNLKVNNEEVLSFQCPSCNNKLFTEIKDEIDIVCYYCGIEIY